MPTDLAQIVAEKVAVLPIEKQQKVLEFVESIEESEKQPEIDEKSAVEALEKLLQDNDFPDRFSVLKPKLEEGKWRVAIALTYPKYEPIWLADAFVDAETGEVQMSLSIGDLLREGKRKAKEAFSIA